jgi:hypothetical protein
VLSNITGADQPPQLFAGLGQTAAKRFREAFAVQPVPQPVDVLAAGIDGAIAV